ncbi:acyltransferase domain-containing protein, partial [Streptomyces sp. NPDC095817]|uniref:acyltransferase domain-containing protein n=1 Tax=Streptomyces sp. NPDC095817 TaxID=3155082 RepID=UPI00332310E8
MSSFGVSGTNTHLILEHPPTPAAGTNAGPIEDTPPAWNPLVVSGRTPRALIAQAHATAEMLEAHSDTPIHYTAAALAHTRTTWEHRAVVLTPDVPTAINALRDIDQSAQSSTPTTITGTANGIASGVAMVFTGQGSQRPGMGAELYSTFAAYREAFDLVCAELDACMPAEAAVHPLRDVVFAQEGTPQAALLDQTLYTQTALFAVEVAMLRLTESWGLKAQMVAGHSLGELTAAHAAGILSLTDAARLVTARGKLMQALPPGGAMLAVHAGEIPVRDLLTDLLDAEFLDVASVNGPEAIVLSGTEEAISRAASVLSDCGYKSRRLTVSHAFHSALMDPMLAEFSKMAESIAFQAPKIPVISALTGDIADPAELCVAAYWVKQVRRTVRFADVVSTLSRQPLATVLEIGPDAVLTGMIKAIADQPAVAFSRRNQSEVHSALTALAEVFVRGGRVEWSAVVPKGGNAVVPTTQFQRERYWLSPGGVARDVSGVGLVGVDHWLLGAVVESPGSGGVVLTGRVGV